MPIPDEYETLRGATLRSVVARLPAQPLLSPVDVALALGVSQQHVQNMIDSGAFPVLDLGLQGRSFLKIEKSVFVSWLESRIK